MLRSPSVLPEFGLPLYSTPDGTQPTATMGTAVTPGTNVYGAYATLIAGASVNDDVYEIEICVNNVGISASARDCVVSIGLDPTGGASFTSLADFVCGPAVAYIANGNGSIFRFPLFIKAGTSIGAAAAVNSATLTAIGVFVILRSRPSPVQQMPVGTYLDQFGVTLVSSSGTAITPGQAAEGAWTQIGAALTRPLWYLDFGYGANNAAMSQAAIDVDIGIGSAGSKKIAIANARVTTNSGEALAKVVHGRAVVAAIGDILYARSQQSSTSNGGQSIAIYGVGG